MAHPLLLNQRALISRKKFLKLYSSQKNLLTSNSFHYWENSKSRIVLLQGIEKFRESRRYIQTQKAQFSKYAGDDFMKNSCFRTSASFLLKRKIVRIYRQKFGYSALFRIIRRGLQKKSKRPFGDKKNRKEVAQCRKN